MFYNLVLSVHNLLRWVVLILGILAVVRATLGWLGRRDWMPADRRWGVFFTSAMDLQVLLGLLLFVVLSPITRAAFQNFGGVMQNPELRFFALEHTFYMVLAVVFAHLGNVLPRRTQNSLAKHRTATIWFALSFIAILLGMPWMRPLLRGP